MGRLPKLRVNYDADALFLFRLADAIERDHLRPKKWREDKIARLKQMARDLQDAPARRKPDEDETEAA